jgi:hypothetical protein
MMLIATKGNASYPVLGEESLSILSALIRAQRPAFPS